MTEFAPFADITAADECREAARWARAARDIVCVTGEPGLGKSYALQRVAAEWPKTAYCEVVTDVQKAPRGFYKLLLRASGAVHDREQMADLEDLCLLRLDSRESETPFLIIVDEFQNLELPTLRTLLYFQERCQFGLVLSGNNETLRSRPKDRVAGQQNRDRIWGVHIQVSNLSAADCRAICIEHNVEGREAYGYLEEFGRKHNVRRLVKLIRAARQNAGPAGSIRFEHIENALVGARGWTDADVKALPAIKQKLRSGEAA